jgi:hypothetical protein
MLGLIVVTGLPNALALDLPAEISLEFDLDNWTRLYNPDGTPFPAGDTPVQGLESRAFITFNDISPTYGPGGADLPAFWVGGMNNEFLHGWERNVVLTQIVPQDDGSLNLYFDHATFDPADSHYWEVEVYLTGISTADFLSDPNYIPLGPANFDTIADNIATHASSSLFIRGRFSYSVYYDPKLAGPVIATTAINIPGSIVGGEWVNQVDLTPYGIGVNAFVDVDPTVGVGAMFTGGFYGYSPIDGTEYDLAIQNVRLNSEQDTHGWIISDDGVRGGTYEEQLGICRVTGGGWDDPTAVTIPGPDMLATMDGDGKGHPVYSFGGQAGAPSASSDPPWGEWQHNFGKGRGPNGEMFAFHGGTSSNPHGTPGTTLISISCSDEGWCSPAREAPFHSIYFDGCGTFTNAKNVDGEGIEVGNLYYFTVHIDDLGEGPGKLDGLNNGQLKKLDLVCPDHDDLHVIPSDPHAEVCAACSDWYEIHIYPGVDPADYASPSEACEAAQANAGMTPIHSVADYINGGNLQIHPLTGADAKK